MKLKMKKWGFLTGQSKSCGIKWLFILFFCIAFKWLCVYFFFEWNIICDMIYCLGQISCLARLTAIWLLERIKLPRVHINFFPTSPFGQVTKIFTFLNLSFSCSKFFNIRYQILSTWKLHFCISLLLIILAIIDYLTFQT